MTLPISNTSLQFKKYAPAKKQNEQNSRTFLSPREKNPPSNAINGLTNSANETQAPSKPVPPTPIRARHLNLTEATTPGADNTTESTSDKTRTSEGVEADLSASLMLAREIRGNNSPPKPLESAITRARRSLKAPNQLLAASPRIGITRNQTSDDQRSFPIRRIELNATYGDDSTSSSAEMRQLRAPHPKRDAFALTKTPKRLNLKSNGETGELDHNFFGSLSNSAEPSQLTSRLTRLGEPLPPRESSSTKEKLFDTLLSPRAVIREVFEAKAAAKAEAKKAKQIQTMLAHLPAGVVLDDNGNLSGTGEFTQVPLGMMDAGTAHYGMPFDTFANIKLASLLKSKVTPIFDKEKPDELNTRQETTRQAMHDMWRHDIEIVNNQVSFKLPDSNKNDRDRTVLLLNSLRELTGSDKATTVLTAMLTQSVPTLFHIGLASPDGNALKSLRLLHSKNSFNVTKTLVKNSDPSQEIKQEIKQVQGLGATKFQVRREGGHFYVSTKLTAYYDATPDAEHILRLRKNEVISIRTTATFKIDGAAAEDGKLEFSIPTGIKNSFEGRLLMN